MNPAIVISAYNRPSSLNRLLDGLKKAQYPRDPVPLVISIDRGGGDASSRVAALAREFDWPFGPKRVIAHDTHLGLVDHVLFCLGLSKEYGSVVFLEDDLTVSPLLYSYAAQALDCYGQDPRIAALCLYGLWFNGYTRLPFVPWPDGSDVFFVQVPFTQGQAWTAAQWSRFEEWRAAGDRTLSPADPVHDMFLKFDTDDWFPQFAKYVVETDRYYVFPRFSVVNGSGDAGTHFTQATAFLQVPLLQARRSFSFVSLDESPAVYDTFFEIKPDRLNRLTDALKGIDYDVDLHATKRPRHLRAPFALTTRPARAHLSSYGRTRWPQEANVVERTPGGELVLARREDLRWDWLADLEADRRNYEYFTRGRRLGKKRALQFALLGLIQRRKA
jgi:hypothetical protein